MKAITYFAAFCLSCYAHADAQRLDYKISDDDDSEYSIISFAESGPTVQAVVRRVGIYFTSYTMVEINCTDRQRRQMGLYNTIEGAQAAEYDPHGPIIEGTLAHNVHNALCINPSVVAEQAAGISGE